MRRFDTELDTGRRYVDAQAVPGRIVFCALSGAHLYGFPSPDSDLDLKGAYMAPTEALLGLGPDPTTVDVTGWQDGVECDVTLLEIGKALDLLVGGNGNVLEQLTSPHQVVHTEEHAALVELAREAVSKRFGKHYRGFLRGLRREFDRSDHPEVKTLLYGYRIACTGLHLLREGRVEANLATLAPIYGMDEVRTLIGRKATSDEHTHLSASEKAEHRELWDELQRRLDEAFAASKLPEEPPNRAAIDAWLIGARRAELR